MRQVKRRSGFPIRPAIARTLGNDRSELISGAYGIRKIPLLLSFPRKRESSCETGQTPPQGGTIVGGLDEMLRIERTVNAIP